MRVSSVAIGSTYGGVDISRGFKSIGLATAISSLVSASIGDMVLPDGSIWNLIPYEYPDGSWGMSKEMTGTTINPKTLFVTTDGWIVSADWYQYPDGSYGWTWEVHGTGGTVQYYTDVNGAEWTLTLQAYPDGTYGEQWNLGTAVVLSYMLDNLGNNIVDESGNKLYLR